MFQAWYAELPMAECVPSLWLADFWNALRVGAFGLLPFLFLSFIPSFLLSFFPSFLLSFFLSLFVCLFVCLFARVAGGLFVERFAIAKRGA